jgi:hypothetical protein
MLAYGLGPYATLAMPSHATLLSGFFDWQTPDWFLELVRRVAPIHFDPCTTPDNPTGADVFFYQQIDTNGAAPWVVKCGLSEDWPAQGFGYFNPRYGAYLGGAPDSDYEHYKEGKLTGFGRGWGKRIAQHWHEGGEGLALLPSRNSCQWWREVYRASQLVCLWNSDEYGSRISFVDPTNGFEVSGNNSDSHVFYSGPNVEAFYETFRSHGEMIPGGLERWRPSGKVAA